jgi:hypothetical protein
VCADANFELPIALHIFSELLADSISDFVSDCHPAHKHSDKFTNDSSHTAYSTTYVQTHLVSDYPVADYTVAHSDANRNADLSPYICAESKSVAHTASYTSPHTAAHFKTHPLTDINTNFKTYFSSHPSYKCSNVVSNVLANVVPDFVTNACPEFIPYVFSKRLSHFTADRISDTDPYAYSNSRAE